MCLAPRSGRSHSVWRQMMRQQQELLKSLTSHRPFVIAGIIKHMARPTKIRVENKICHVGSELAGPWYVTFRRVTHFSIFYYFQESENDIRDLFHSSFFSNYSFSVLLSIVEMQQVRHPVSTKKYKNEFEWETNRDDNATRISTAKIEYPFEDVQIFFIFYFAVFKRCSDYSWLVSYSYLQIIGFSLAIHILMDRPAVCCI